jgi:hypothetical protein
MKRERTLNKADKEKLMAKKTQKFEPQVESTVENNEIVPRTIVEATEAEVFANQTEGQEAVVEGPVVASAGDTQPEEKPAPKLRINKRPYIARVTEILELGMDRKSIVKLVLAEFPTVKKGGVETFLTDCLNPKYSFFKERKVTKSPDGKLIFADRLIPGIIVAEEAQKAETTEAQPTEAETPTAETVPTEEVQPEQPTE